MSLQERFPVQPGPIRADLRWRRPDGHTGRVAGCFRDCTPLWDRWAYETLLGATVTLTTVVRGRGRCTFTLQADEDEALAFLATSNPTWYASAQRKRSRHLDLH